MKKLIFFLFAATALTQFISSQWVYQPVPNNVNYFLTIDFSSLTNGSAGGMVSSNFNGRGVYTTNSGINWIVSSVPDSTRVMVDIEFVNNSTGFCAGAYNTAIVSDLPVTAYGIYSKYDKRNFRRLGDNEHNGAGYKGLFLKTVNGGQSWLTYGSLPSNVYYMLGIDFINETTGYAIVSFDFSGGVNDGVIKTTNGGINWSILSLPEVINNLSDIEFVNASMGFVVGYDVVNDTARGVILRTSNAGLNWQRQINMEHIQYRSVSFSDQNTGLIVSGLAGLVQFPASRVYRTTNSGVNWSAGANFPDVEFMDVNFVKGTGTSLVCGSRYLSNFESLDYSARSTDYGLTWQTGSFNDTSLGLFTSELINSSRWFIAGGNFNSQQIPVILYTANGSPIGVSQTGNQIPLNYSLQQNYPNPFNPVTNIKFSIPQAGFVKLVIFDVSGKEISTLVSQSMKAGIYVADFDASSLTSGVYFYRIEAGEYRQTKKMVLIK